MDSEELKKITSLNQSKDRKINKQKLLKQVTVTGTKILKK